jgi:hypothetical protein
MGGGGRGRRAVVTGREEGTMDGEGKWARKEKEWDIAREEEGNGGRREVGDRDLCPTQYFT